MHTPDLLLDQAIRLMEFLARTQELKEKVVRNVNAYNREGAVRWFANFPKHDVITLKDVAEPGTPFLTVQRLDTIPVPALPREIENRVTTPLDDPKNPPKLQSPQKLESSDKADDESEEAAITSFNKWLEKWKGWAEKERLDQTARDFYTSLFQLRRNLQRSSEEMELVVGSGLLTWTPNDHEQVQRHLFIAPLNIDLDTQSGVLSVSISEDAVALKTELDMLDPSAFGSKDIPAEIRARVEELSPIELSNESIEVIGRPTVYDLAAEGRFEDILGVPEQTPFPVISYSPALILRPRPSGGLAKIFHTIAEQMKETGMVPSGLKPLLNPNLEPPAQPDPQPGAITKIGEEFFSPLPLNDVQKRIIERVDNNAQTLVQGPPGTGKTHTAAALLTHLLAQGKRILVTAKTDRALYEVRDKLPEMIKPLAVSVIGSSRNDMAELTSAVDTISKASDEFDAAENLQAIDTKLGEIDQLRIQRQRLINEVVESYAIDSSEQEVSDYKGTSAELARAYLADVSRYQWIMEYPTIWGATNLVEVRDHYLEWLELERDSSLNQDRSQMIGEDASTIKLPLPEEMNEVFARVRAAKADATFETTKSIRKLTKGVAVLSEEKRNELVNKIPVLSQSFQRFTTLPQQWLVDAFNEIRFGAFDTWWERIRSLDQAVKNAEKLSGKLGNDVNVKLQGEWDTYRLQAERILDHVTTKGSIATRANGQAKIGMFTASVVKECRSFLEEVTVNGVSPTTAESITSLLEYMELSNLLGDYEDRWSFAGSFDSAQKPEVRISQLKSILSLLKPMVDFALEFIRLEEYLVSQGAPAIGWESESLVLDYQLALRHRVDVEKLEEEQQSFLKYSRRLDSLVNYGKSADWVEEMKTALNEKDAQAYASAYAVSLRLTGSKIRLDRREELSTTLSGLDSAFFSVVKAGLSSQVWDQRLLELKQAADWRALGEYLNSASGIDPNINQTTINELDDQIREVTGDLAALRAWGEAVRPERLDRTSRASLTNYVQQVRKLGKGKSKYATQKRAAVQRALDECRSAVPVWIMPISRIVDQLAIEENLFDVVLVDEASQAGMEASFLQYLAPKIVVIGDDKQVSPSAGFIDQQQVRDLAKQYLEGIAFNDSWVDSTKSLFDDANLRFGGKLTLVEHRRCVPEIINFSNKIAYEPEKIKLVPVRQVGVDRLAAFKVVYTKHGYQKSSGTENLNPVEADAIVDQIIKCMKDPAYAGMSFGVISLLGMKQAKLIESRLLARVDAREWEKRHLMVGIAPDFQGAERDVMFLSMVATTEPGKRSTSLTSDIYIQRFNVAVSRAKEQVWIFHSMPLSSLENKEDMRFQLLDYAYGVARQSRSMTEISPSVPDDERVTPFDSLFEQRVYNQIAGKGFTVRPQVEALGYSIDLVVEGANGKIAVECDGDHWHGPEVYEKDLARQRDLERCGWEFFRIRESEYYLDPTQSLKGLWDALEQKEIFPSDWVGEDLETEENVIVLDGSTDLSFVDESEDIDEPAGEEIESLPIQQLADERTPKFAARIKETVAAPAEPFVDDENDTNLHEISFDQMKTPEFDLVSIDTSPELGEIGLSSSEYQAFSGVTKPATTANVNAVIEGMIEVLEVEGPMQGKYLMQVYHQSSGGKRLSRDITHKINSAISKAVRSKKIIKDNPMNIVGNKLCSYRLPDQPEVRIRPAGARKLEDLPYNEILALIEHIATPSMDNEQMMRGVLSFYGRSSLTVAARKLLEPIVEFYESNR